MNEIVNKQFWTGNKFLSKLHLRQLGFISSAGGSFTKHPERIQKFKETGALKNINRGELDKSFSTHNTAYTYSKDLAKITFPEKILKDKCNEIALNSKHGGYGRALTSMLYRFLIRKKGQE